MLTQRIGSKCIARFSKESILDAPHNAVVAPGAVSKLEYFCTRDSSFCVLSDEATVAGVQLRNDKAVAKEHITDKSRQVVTYGAGRSPVLTVAVDQCANALLAGESDNNNGRVVQYRLDTGDVARDYGSLGIGTVLSSARVGNLCFFWGIDSSSFVVVDTTTQKIVQSPVKTAIGKIESITVCTASPSTPDAKAVLAVAGQSIDYSTGHSDMFDFTELVHRHGSRETVAEFATPVCQREQDLMRQVRTLEGRLQKLQAEYDAQVAAKASLQARADSLEQQLRQQRHAHAATIETRDRERGRLESDNQTLRESVHRLRKKRGRIKSKYKAHAIWNGRLVSQKVILGLFDHSPMALDAGASPGTAMDASTMESLRVRLATTRRRNQALAAFNQEILVKNLDLQAEVCALRAPCGGW